MYLSPRSAVSKTGIVTHRVYNICCESCLLKNGNRIIVVLENAWVAIFLHISTYHFKFAFFAIIASILNVELFFVSFTKDSSGIEAVLQSKWGQSPLETGRVASIDYLITIIINRFAILCAKNLSNNISESN